MGFYTVSHGKFHDRGYSDILYGKKQHSRHGMLYSNTQYIYRNGNYLVLLPRFGGYSISSAGTSSGSGDLLRLS